MQELFYNIEDLLPELCQNIFSKLNTIDLFFCTKVCQKWSDVIHSNLPKEYLNYIAIEPESCPRCIIKNINLAFTSDLDKKEKCHKHIYGFITKKDLCRNSSDKRIVKSWPRRKNKTTIRDISHNNPSYKDVNYDNINHGDTNFCGLTPHDLNCGNINNDNRFCKDLAKYTSLKGLFASVPKEEILGYGDLLESNILRYKPLNKLLKIPGFLDATLIEESLYDIIMNKDYSNILDHLFILNLITMDNIESWLSDEYSHGNYHKRMFDIWLKYGYFLNETGEESFVKSLKLCENTGFYKHLIEHFKPSCSRERELILPEDCGIHCHSAIWLVKQGFILSLESIKNIEVQYFGDNSYRSFYELCYTKGFITKEELESLLH